ncbi:hypothetical protein DM01DRAFT_1148973 [Hesseltinella vesiculosa]|uniref:Uncharacterized protein n=1 Tax=Hesseltinella vesiculosa TaxID=101127 RepID=A0A1X2G6M9_9FUNG|nr:hypothetical protein DM01DRAFT_1148973 [Hesseltinella vesiculosa]
MLMMNANVKMNVKYFTLFHSFNMVQILLYHGFLTVNSHFLDFKVAFSGGQTMVYLLPKLVLQCLFSVWLLAMVYLGWLSV